ncbi:MAG: hypothetical protein QG602_407 [Verrucomicrobiota bacterium]|nr:hypothetical protein [Verrucomicrobiota bacterium]
MASIFDRKSHGLGAMATDWVPKHTKENDSLAALAKGYGVKAAEIASQNGVKFDTKAIQAWVKASGGRVLPFEPNSHPFPDSNEGWAVFTSSSVIKLPANARLDGEPEVNVAQASSAVPLTREQAKAQAIEAAKAKARAAAEARAATGAKSPDMGGFGIPKVALIAGLGAAVLLVLKKMGKI